MTLYLERTQLAEERDIQKENQNVKQNTIYRQQPTNLDKAGQNIQKLRTTAKCFVLLQAGMNSILIKNINSEL